MKTFTLLLTCILLNCANAVEILSQKENACLKSLYRTESTSIEYSIANNTSCIREQVRQNISSGVGTNHFRPLEIRILNTPNNELDLQSATAISMIILTSMRNAQFIAISNNLKMSDALATVENTLKNKTQEAYEQSAKHNRGFQKNNETFQTRINETFQKIKNLKSIEASRLNQINSRPQPSQNLGGHLNDGVGSNSIETGLNNSNVTNNTPILNPRYRTHINNIQDRKSQPCVREIEKHKKAKLTQEDSYALARACQFFSENDKQDLAEKALEASQRIRYAKQGKLSADVIPQDERELSEQVASFYKDKDAIQTLQKKVQNTMQMPDVDPQWKRGAQQALEASQTYQAAADAAFLEFQIGIAKQLLKMTWFTLDTVLSFTPIIGTAKDFMIGTVGYKFDGESIVKISNDERAFLLAAATVSSTVDFAIISPTVLKYLSKVGTSTSHSLNLNKVTESAQVILESAAKLGVKTGEEIKDLTKIAKSSAGESSELIAKNIDQYAEAARLGAGPKLTSSHIANFKDGKYFNRKLEQDEIFFRYHGEDNRTGKKFVYITKSEYPNEDALRNGVAMLEEWGSITEKSKIKVPAGSWVSEGLAAPQKSITSSEIRLGGDYQALLTTPDVPVSWILNTTKKAF